MGQVHSEVADSSIDGDCQTGTSSSSMEDLIAEAAAFGSDEENVSVDAKAQKALECPCIAPLRSGPCGSQFSDAFLCFLKSTAEEKGADCVNPFVALQICIKANSSAFSEEILGEDEKVEAEPSKEYRFIPPNWAADGAKPKL